MSLVLTSVVAWYTEGSPRNNAEVAAHFAKQRPVLGLCLKRYTMTPSGQAVRLNTYIDIPLEIGLPHFIQDEDGEDSGRLFGNFKLVLQSAVCHRGVSVDSGHYVTLVRGPPIDTDAREAQTEIDGVAPSYREPAGDKWMLFDDLAVERVKYVDMNQALRDESPYLLFYQVRPIDDTYLGENGFEEAPPAYSERPSTGENAATHAPSVGESRSDTADGLLPSLGPRSESSTKSDAAGRPSGSSEWRRSIVFLDGPLEGLAVSQGRSRPLTPTDGAGENSSRGSSRRQSRIEASESKSRQHSQVGEGRLSATFSRFADRMTRENKTSALVVNSADDVGSETAVKEIREFDQSTKRAKSKSRGKLVMPGSSSNEKDKVGDRECVVM